MSGNLRYTKQLISELECYALRSGAVLHTKHQRKPQLTKNEAAISIAVKRVTAKTSRRTPGLDEITWVDPHERLEGRDILL